MNKLFKPLFLLAIFSITNCTILVASEWLDQKFSMFIHFGLYSELGGVWNNRPIEQGYSEQIQSFAKIPEKQYQAVAQRFNPTNFNADSIADLALAAGMRSIVITSKHHDGFSIYNTAFSDYNIVDATPYKQDILLQLSQACKRKGLRFGVYFSLVDWNFPFAADMSPHNADVATPQHHEFNLRQVRELLTNYGDISELWFDMGSLSPQQSRELYDLVKSIQPNCMVSSRLGNETGDFAVMGDNKLPEYKIALPWQTAASIYPETWGYRSWQKHVELNQKVDEKVATLVKVISHGGNFLLNIGPKGDGSIPSFEADVLRGIGNFTHKYADALYATSPNPWSHSMEWGEATVKDNFLYLFINKMPENRTIVLDSVDANLLSAASFDNSVVCKFSRSHNQYSVRIPNSVGCDNGFFVVKLKFDAPVALLKKTVNSRFLTAENAEKISGAAFLDYYIDTRSIVGYSWTVDASMLQNGLPKLIYPSCYEGDSLLFTITPSSVSYISNISSLDESLSVDNSQSIGGESATKACRSKNLLISKSPIRGESLPAVYRELMKDAVASDLFNHIFSEPRSLPQMLKEGYSKPYSDFAGPFRYRYFKPRKTKSVVDTMFDFSEKYTLLYIADYSTTQKGYDLLQFTQADAVSVYMNGELIFSQLYAQTNSQSDVNLFVPSIKGKNRIEVRWHYRTPRRAKCHAQFVNASMPYNISTLSSLSTPANPSADDKNEKISSSMQQNYDLSDDLAIKYTIKIMAPTAKYPNSALNLRDFVIVLPQK